MKPKMFLQQGRTRRQARRKGRGFTLVELLVSVSMSMGVAVGVFALAGQSVRTFSSEARLGDAHVNALTGFERMRADISRAGFHVTPNILRDPHVCGPVPATGLVSDLAAVRIQTGLDEENGITAHRLTLAGAYDWPEQFRVQEYENVNGVHVFRLALQGAEARLRESQVPLAHVFRPNQLLRVITPEGNEQYLTITGVDHATDLSLTTRIEVKATGDLYTAGGDGGNGGYPCGVRALCTDCLVNPVNVVRYQVSSLGPNENYEHMYADKHVGQFYDDEKNRLELVRVELEASGGEVPDSQELVAEYVVGLDFGIHVANLNGAGTQLDFYTADRPEYEDYAGLPQANNIVGPQLLRGLRTRLSVRSRQADRRAASAVDTGTAPYAFQLDANPPRFARVRNIQSDIALNNLYGITWQ